jgi:hypothetical protein
MPPTIADFQAAGLYDPAAPDAAKRLALLEWLVERGASVEQMVRAVRTGTLLDVAGELGRAPGRRLTLAEAAAVTGMSAERIEAIRFAVGLPRAAADEPVVGEEEARSFEVFRYGEELFGLLRRGHAFEGEHFARPQFLPNAFQNPAGGEIVFAAESIPTKISPLARERSNAVSVASADSHCSMSAYGSSTED